MAGAQAHAFVTHFAVGLLLASAVCDVIGLLARREALLFAGRWMTILGAVAAWLAVLAGLWARAALAPHSASGESLEHLHAALGYVVAILWTPVAAWRATSKPALPAKLRTAYLALAFTGAMAVLGETGLGTALVYAYGLGLSPAARATPQR